MGAAWISTLPQGGVHTRHRRKRGLEASTRGVQPANTMAHPVSMTLLTRTTTARASKNTKLSGISCTLDHSTTLNHKQLSLLFFLVWSSLPSSICVGVSRKDGCDSTQKKPYIVHLPLCYHFLHDDYTRRV